MTTGLTAGCSVVSPVTSLAIGETRQVTAGARAVAAVSRQVTAVACQVKK